MESEMMVVKWGRRAIPHSTRSLLFWSKDRTGFTLLELMVALSILAIALAAVMRAVGAATANLDEVRLRTLAMWVADNRLAEHRARSSWLALGKNEGQAQQGEVNFSWIENVQATPNAQFRRIEVTVWLMNEADQTKNRQLHSLNGFLSQPKVTR